MAKGLKTANLKYLIPVVAVHGIIFHFFLAQGKLSISSVPSLLDEWYKSVPIAAVAAVITIVVNGILPAHAKARLVFLRWRHPLPGHRAFSRYASKDPRIDTKALESRLGQIPTDPEEQNRVWYRLLKQHESDAGVEQSHQYWLLTRDLTGLSVLLAIAFGGLQITLGKDWHGSIYWFLLGIQYLMCLMAARHYGVRLVTDVLARESVKAYRTAT